MLFFANFLTITFLSNITYYFKVQVKNLILLLLVFFMFFESALRNHENPFLKRGFHGYVKKGICSAEIFQYYFYRVVFNTDQEVMFSSFGLKIIRAIIIIIIVGIIQPIPCPPSGILDAILEIKLLVIP